MDEREIETVLREGLERRAGEAVVEVGVLARARAEVGRRRRTRLAVGVASAAAAVVAVAGGVVAADRLGDEPPVVPGPAPSVADDPNWPAPGEWRTEYWADVAVAVPADWGYGGAPDASGTACYPEAMVDRDGRRLEGGSERGWVGRPITGTDVCASVPGAWEPRAPYVWLGAGVEPGTYEYANGYVQETVEVDGSTVTVGSRDATLRARILESAQGGEACLSELEVAGEIRHDAADDPDAEAAGMNVCVYGMGPERGEIATLTYAARLGRGAVAAYSAALGGAEEGQTCAAADYIEDEWVVLEMVDAEGAVLRQDVVHLGCSGIDLGATSLRSDSRVPLTEARVAPWAVGGIPAVVHYAGQEPWVYDYFIGPQG